VCATRWAKRNTVGDYGGERLREYDGLKRQIASTDHDCLRMQKCYSGASRQADRRQALRLHSIVVHRRWHAVDWAA
jgi:hypothetical protein